MSKIRKAAQGQACMVRLPGVCNFDPQTTVLAHLNGGGMGKKRPDFQGAFCCSACHDVIDRRAATKLSWYEVETYWHEGIFRTQELLWSQGLIKTPGSK